MAEQSDGKLNRLERILPDSLLVDAAWLSKQGYSTSLLSQYVTAGWLVHPVRQVYQRREGRLTWQQAVVSLQAVLGRDLIVGGRTALELQGFAHYLSQDRKLVHLYGPKRPPAWLNKLPLDVQFVYHNSRRLFGSASPTRTHENRILQPWGPSGQLALSSPEQAVLELLDGLPNNESFDQADKLMEGLSTLSPRRLQQLLLECRSIKVKRLFFFLAGRHRHAWLKHLDKNAIDLGKGKRMLVRGGKLDATYGITVPEDLDAVH